MRTNLFSLKPIEDGKLFCIMTYCFIFSKIYILKLIKLPILTFLDLRYSGYNPTYWDKRPIFYGEYIRVIIASTFKITSQLIYYNIT